MKFVSKKMQKKEQVAHEADVLLHVQNHQLVALLDTYESPTCLMLILELYVVSRDTGGGGSESCRVVSVCVCV